MLNLFQHHHTEGGDPETSSGCHTKKPRIAAGLFISIGNTKGLSFP